MEISDWHIGCVSGWMDQPRYYSRYRAYRTSYNDNDMERAIEMVHNGSTLAEAEFLTKVPQATLRRRLLKCQMHHGPCKGAFKPQKPLPISSVSVNQEGPQNETLKHIHQIIRAMEAEKSDSPQKVESHSQVKTQRLSTSSRDSPSDFLSTESSGKRGSRVYTEEDMEKAVALVHEGYSLAKAEIETGVPSSTIRARLSSCTAHQGPCKGAFNVQESNVSASPTETTQTDETHHEQKPSDDLNDADRDHEKQIENKTLIKTEPNQDN